MFFKIDVMASSLNEVMKIFLRGESHDNYASLSQCDPVLDSPDRFMTHEIIYASCFRCHGFSARRQQHRQRAHSKLPRQYDDGMPRGARVAVKFKNCKLALPFIWHTTLIGTREMC